MEGKKRQGPACWEVCHFSGGLGLSPTWCNVEKLTQSLLNKCKLWKHDGKPKGNKEHSMGFLAAYTFECSPNAHLVVCFCVCFNQDCFLEEIGLEPKALCFLKGVTSFPGPKNHGQGPWHKAQPCSSLGPEVQAGYQSEDHGPFYVWEALRRKVWGGPGSNVSMVLKVQGNEEQTQAWEEAWTGGSWGDGGGNFYFLNRCRVFPLC